MAPNKKTNRCPHGWNLNEPCTAALDRIYAIQAENRPKYKNSPEPDIGCPWYIKSAEHNYCFWNLAKELNGSPFTDKEICQLLGLSAPQLREIYQSGIKKLIDIKDSPVIQELVDIVAEVAESKNENPDTLPEGFRSVVKTAEERIAAKENGVDGRTEVDEMIDGEPNRKIRRGFGMPLHRDGKKVDLYGLYSHRNKHNVKKKKTDSSK